MDTALPVSALHTTDTSSATERGAGSPSGLGMNLVWTTERPSWFLLMWRIVDFPGTANKLPFTGLLHWLHLVATCIKNLT